MLPTFLIVGAQKAGTTTLTRLLESHPDVFVTDPRETFFFASEDEYARGIGFYEQEYFGEWTGEGAAGEKTPEYLFLEDVPERIANDLGTDVRIVITLRSPAMRAHSHWRHNLQGRRESMAFFDALDAEASRVVDRDTSMAFGYLARGRYHAQVKRYVGLFPATTVFVMEQDFADQASLAKQLFGAVGVDTSHTLPKRVQAGRPRIPELIRPDETITIEGRGESILIPGGAIAYRFGGGRIEVLAQPSDSEIAYANAFAMITQTADEPLGRAEELAMNANLEDDIVATAELIGRDLSAWLE